MIADVNKFQENRQTSNNDGGVWGQLARGLCSKSAKNKIFYTFYFIFLLRILQKIITGSMGIVVLAIPGSKGIREVFLFKEYSEK